MSEKQIIPLADRVLIDPEVAQEKTTGGIILPESAKEKPQRGRVVSVGKGKPQEPLTVKKNDQVLYSQYAGTEIRIEEKSYLIMRESDILAIIV